MQIQFYKYQGAGNDFIMIDSRKISTSAFTEETVKRLCHRNFGIGADGLILLMTDELNDFRMKYFNSNGKEGTMCGNGGRCIVAFARQLGLISDRTKFSGIDGGHEGFIRHDGMIELQMIDVPSVEKLEDGYLLETGSTHFVIFSPDVNAKDVFTEGHKIRYQKRFGDTGTNVNFVEIIDEGHLKIRTYERGVENETLACGTGAVASAISSCLKEDTDKNSYLIEAKGGKLEVRFQRNSKDQFTDIWLCGPAEYVFEGIINI